MNHARVEAVAGRGSGLMKNSRSLSVAPRVSSACAVPSVSGAVAACNPRPHQALPLFGFFTRVEDLADAAESGRVPDQRRPVPVPLGLVVLVLGVGVVLGGVRCGGVPVPTRRG